jgi:hypothetical protein
MNMETNIAEPPTQPKRTGLIIWMILSQLFAVGSLVIWLVMAGLSVMAFDQGSTPEAWTFVIAVWSYPLFPLLIIIGSWIAFRRRRNTLAAVLSGLSFAPPVLCIIFIWAANAIWFAQNGGLDAFRP